MNEEFFPETEVAESWHGYPRWCT